jgi:hypothetical protein
MFLNKVVIFRQSVEIFVNLIPLSHLCGIDININSQELTSTNELKSPEIGENTPENKEKDGFDPSTSISPIHSENLIGSPSWIRTNDPAVNRIIVLSFCARVDNSLTIFILF